MKNKTINTHLNDSPGHSHKAFTLHLLRAPQPKLSCSFFSRVLGNVCVPLSPASLCTHFLAGHFLDARLKLGSPISCSCKLLAPWLTTRWCSGQRHWGLKPWTFSCYYGRALPLGFRYLGGINESLGDSLQSGFAKLICMGRGETEVLEW